MEHLRDVMTSNVEYCTPQDNIYEAAVKMRDQDCGVIPVCDNGQVLGMLTDRDIVLRAVAEKKPNSTQVTEVMTDKLICASPDMNIDEAAKMMAEKQIRRLPIVENNKLVGIVALGDLAVRRVSAGEAGHALSEISESHQVHH